MTDEPLPLGRRRLVVSPKIDASRLVALPDWRARLRAMTRQHLDLSLLPLCEAEPVVMTMGGVVYCHPANADLARGRA